MFYTVTIAAINIYSVKLADRVGVVFSSTKLVAMGIIVVGGAVRIAQGWYLVASLAHEISRVINFIKRFGNTNNCM